MMAASNSLRVGRTPNVLAGFVLALSLAASLHPPVALGNEDEAGTAPDPLSTMELSLDQARALALANDERIREVTEAVLAADADALGARADALPQLSLAGTYTRNFKNPVMFLSNELAQVFGGLNKIEMGGDYDLEGAALLTFNLWTAGRLSAAAGVADEAVLATQWQKALVQDAVVYELEAAYFGVLLASANAAIAEKAMDSAVEALRVTRAAFDQGTSSRFDQLRAEVEVANRETPLIQARNLEALAVQTLLRLCGLPSDSTVELTTELAPVNDPDPLPDLLADMEANSPELRSLEHRVAAQKQMVRLAKAGRGPVVQLQGQYAIQGQWDDDLTPGEDETATSASAALAVSIPIFDGFAAKSDIGRSEAELRRAEANLDRVTRDRELGVRQSRIYLANSLAALQGRRESVDLAEEAHRLALVRLENGLATPLERLDAELALIDARTQLAEVLHRCNVAEAALKLAVGTHAAPVDGSQEDR